MGSSRSRPRMQDRSALGCAHAAASLRRRGPPRPTGCAASTTRCNITPRNRTTSTSSRSCSVRASDCPASSPTTNLLPRCCNPRMCPTLPVRKTCLFQEDCSTRVAHNRSRVDSVQLPPRTQIRGRSPKPQSNRPATVGLSRVQLQPVSATLGWYAPSLQAAGQGGAA